MEYPAMKKGDRKYRLFLRCTISEINCTFAKKVMIMKEEQEIPEFIQGLATKKSEAQQRREIVEKEYLKLLDKLAKKSGKNKKNTFEPARKV